MNLVISLLINLINNPKTNAVDRDIAVNLINNYKLLKIDSITILAKSLNVSISQLSRFVKNIGFNSYRDFKEIIEYHGVKSRHTDLQQGLISLTDYSKQVTEEINYFYRHFKIKQIDNLVSDLHTFKKIALFGLLNSDNGAKELQYNLMRLNKICISYNNLDDQLEYINNAKEDTLIVIFSMSGQYVLDNNYNRYYQATNYLKNTKAKVYVISSNEEVNNLIYLDETIIIPSIHNLSNYTLQSICDLILLAYQQS